MNSFVKRTLSGALLLIIVFGAVLMGGNVWIAFSCVLSAIAVRELFTALGISKTSMEITAYVLCAATYASFAASLAEASYAVPVIYFIILMAIYVVKWPGYDINAVAKSFFAFFYAVVCMACLCRLRMYSVNYVWLVFISAWGSDTFAYVTGMVIGRHKVPGTLSPKKTVEGCLGGIIGAGAIGFIYGAVRFGISKAVIYAAICMAGAVLSQIGDLAASAVKRNCGIKDYGKLIPGHGGVMDRFDSILFIAPIIYCIAYIALRLSLDIL